jgi:hypothetical protein
MAGGHHAGSKGEVSEELEAVKAVKQRTASVQKIICCSAAFLWQSSTCHFRGVHTLSDDPPLATADSIYCLVILSRFLGL